MNTANIIVLWVTGLILLCIPTKANFENEVLQEHNKYRAKHGCPKLELDDDLNAECKGYAEILAEKGALEHSKGTYGENLCFTTQNPVSCVKSWYDEIKDYDFGKGAYSPTTGHFTQLVWKSSKTLGVGQALDAGRKNYVVARYKPGGNIVGEFKENVPKPKKASSSSVKANIFKYVVLVLWSSSALLL